jgi:hypothetical protein
VSSQLPPRSRPGPPSRGRPPQSLRSSGRRDILVGVGSLVVLVGAISGASVDGAAVDGAHKSRVATAGPAAPAPASPAPSPSVAAAQRTFMDQAARQYGLAGTEQVKILKIGNDICGMLSQGSSLDYISGAIREANSRLPARAAQGLVNLATSDLCPISMPAPSPASS